MRRVAELYGAWLLGALSMVGFAYWFYSRNESLMATNTVSEPQNDSEPLSTDDTGDTGAPSVIAQIRPRRFD